MMRLVYRFLMMLMVSLVLCGTGCEMVRQQLESPAERLVRLRGERMVLLDGLYAEYGGGDVADAAQQVVAEAEAAAGSHGILDMARALVSETDRAAFESGCEFLGSGQRPRLLTETAREFFARADVRERCMEVGRLSREVTELQVALGSGGT